jgi:ureidoacrylate peracid hydrolase
MPIDPAKTAVVLIEYQNDFTSEGGVLHGAVETVMKKTDMLANTERVVEAARSAGATIMHAPITEELDPQDGDIVIEGKRGLDTFASTNLDFILRSKGISTIVLGGFLTNCCVESTMRSGYENGYEVITLSDCVAATSVEEHDNAIRYDYPMFSKPMTSAELIAELS